MKISKLELCFTHNKGKNNLNFGYVLLESLQAHLMVGPKTSSYIGELHKVLKILPCSIHLSVTLVFMPVKRSFMAALSRLNSWTREVFSLTWMIKGMSLKVSSFSFRNWCQGLLERLTCCTRGSFFKYCPTYKNTSW